jgi:hypothetical protein
MYRPPPTASVRVYYYTHEPIIETHVRIDLLNELVHALTGELNFIAVIFGDLDGVVVDFHLAI